MGRDSGLVRGLVDWLTGGLSARLDFLERDVDALQRETQEIARHQDGVTHVLADHQQRLDGHAVEIRRQADQMSDRLGQPFPGKACPSCGAAMLFQRDAAEKSYALSCSSGCVERLMLPEASLLQTFSSGA
jgi:hypothetical protein